MIPLSFLHAACFIHICLCPVSCIMQSVLCPVLVNYDMSPSCHVNHLSPPTSHSLFFFQFVILLKLLFNGGNRLHVSIVPLNTPKPINRIHDNVSTTANAIQYVFTEYVTPRSADTYSVRKVSGRNRMVALLMSSATLVRRSTPADCDMATSWKFCLYMSVIWTTCSGQQAVLTICTSPSFWCR
jgi:hypothetical protein